MLFLLGTILGGIGLFLLAIHMMTDGLRLAAGASLRKALSQWSRTPLRGIFSGFLMTAIVQSSSAVTIASLGFVNAGLINMRQALGIIYGANVGTTMTGWLVALIGFKLNIQAFALPMIGIGMAMGLIRKQGRSAHFGIALVGFGLFFLGIDVLKSAFDGLVQGFDISKYTLDGASGVLAFFGVGFVMTLMTQSSSASIALIIAAVSSGVVGIYAGGAMVVGANVGTTSTAVLASIGATANAKRVAAAQVIFNLGTGVVALCILPFLFDAITWFCDQIGVEADLAISLAVFHTVFNILGVILIYPHNERLASWLDTRFKSLEEEEARPQYLDKTIAATPVLAVNALVLETLALSERVAGLFRKAVNDLAYDNRAVDHEARVIQVLSAKVSHFIVNVGNASMSGDTTQHLAQLMRIDQYFLSCVQACERLGTRIRERESLELSECESELRQFLNAVIDNIQESLDDEFVADDPVEHHYAELKAEHDTIKARLIEAATRDQVAVSHLSETIDCLAEALQFVQNWFKAIARLRQIQAKLSVNGEGSDVEKVDLNQ